MSDTSIGVTDKQKRDLIHIKSQLEQSLERDVSQGEAISVSSKLAEKHLEECVGELTEVE